VPLRDKPEDQPSRVEPSDVPFIGWSLAAHEFRTIAAREAPAASFGLSSSVTLGSGAGVWLPRGATLQV
jgi:hypothetical protein